MIAALLALGLVGLWQLYAGVGGVDDLILPAPSEIATALWTDRELLWDNFVVTAGEVALGIAAALALGFACAVAMHFSRSVRRATYPLLVASQAIPVVIVAPLLVVWLGFGIGPKVAIIAVICFFPITVTTLDALGRVDRDTMKLLRTLDATRWGAFRFAEAPAALPAAQREDRGRGGGDRRGVRGVRRLVGGARPPHPAGDPAAGDRPRLGGGRRAGGVRRRPLLRPRLGPAAAGALDQNRKDVMTVLPLLPFAGPAPVRGAA